MRKLLATLAIILTGCRVIGPVVYITDSPEAVVTIEGTSSDGQQGKTVGVDPVAAVGVGGSSATLTTPVVLSPVDDDAGATPGTE